MLARWNIRRIGFRQSVEKRAGAVNLCLCDIGVAGAGPRSCPFYEPGPARKVPGRRGMTYTEEDWVDIEATSHRRLDE
jgi:hypothetical protein